jgi:hypothetical protein
VLPPSSEPELAVEVVSLYSQLTRKMKRFLGGQVQIASKYLTTSLLYCLNPEYGGSTTQGYIPEDNIQSRFDMQP